MSPHTRTAQTLRRILRDHGREAATGIARVLSDPAIREEFLRDIRENRKATESPFPNTKP